jgi:hypothetical protein
LRSHRPVVLLGEFSTGKSQATPYLERHGWGRMWVTRTPAFEYEGEPFGIDNGAFSAWKNGAVWDETKFLRCVDAALGTGRVPILAVTPDIVAGGERSLEFSARWVEKLPASLPWYLAVQDGMTPDRVEPFMAGFRGIFLGGTDEFKRQAPLWCDFAHGLDVPFHWARCGTARLIREAIAVGADSVDSSTPVRQLGVGRKHLVSRYVSEYIGTGQGELPW